MAPRINSEDLVDAHGVAEILGLAHRNTVSQYQKRYPEMPRPIVDFGGGRTKLWLGSEMRSWAERQTSSGRTRPGRRASS
jgi:hypothetical protein